MKIEQMVEGIARGATELQTDKAVRTDLSTNQYVEITRRMNHRVMRLLHGVMGMQTETGELMSPLKKHIIYGQPLDVQNMREELGDITWYLRLLCHELGINLYDLIEENIEKLKKRYPDKFTEELAAKRLDKADEELQIFTELKGINHIWYVAQSAVDEMKGREPMWYATMHKPDVQSNDRVTIICQGNTVYRGVVSEVILPGQIGPDFETLGDVESPFKQWHRVVFHPNVEPPLPESPKPKESPASGFYDNTEGA